MRGSREPGWQKKHDFMATFDTPKKNAIKFKNYLVQDHQQCLINIAGEWTVAPFRTLEDRYYGASVAQLADGRAFVLGGPSGSASSVLLIFLN